MMRARGLHRFTVFIVMVLSVNAFVMAQSAPRSIIVLGPPSKARHDKGKYDEKIIRVMLNEHLYTTATMEIITEDSGLTSYFTARDNALIYKTQERKDGSDTASFLNIRGVQGQNKKIHLFSMFDPARQKQIYKIDDFSISHDKKLISFVLYGKVRFRSVDVLTSSVYILNLIDGNLKEIVPSGGLCALPVFSPDDKNIGLFRNYSG